MLTVVLGNATWVTQDARAGEGETIYGVLAATARNQPDAVALRDRGTATTYGELLTLADEDAARLRALGVDAGDRVVIWLPNGLRWASLFFACARIGAVCVPAGTRLRALDIRHIVRDCAPRVLVYQSRFLGIDYESMIGELRREIAADRNPFRTKLVAVANHGSTASHVLNAVHLAKLPAPSIDHDAAAIVCYTSGTTGRPKGCVHAHRALVRNGRIAASLIRLSGEDRILCPVPFAHIFGFHMGILQATLAGAALINAEPYKAARVLDLASADGATVLYLVPTMAREMLREQRMRRRDLARVRVTLIGGAPVTEDVRRNLCDPSYGWSGGLSIVYGCTEAPTLTQLVPDDPPRATLRSVGRPTPGVSLRICEHRRAERVPLGEVGEIVTRGYNQMLGYLGDARGTQAKYRNGWLTTGDLGWVDADGYLYFAGRETDMFLVGGFNVYPREVEGQLEEFEEVAEAAVVGVPDTRLGAVPMAWVIPASPSLTEERLLTWAEANLAGYKRPRYARVVRSLPRTDSGKVSRVKLDQLARRALPHLDWEAAQR